MDSHKPQIDRKTGAVIDPWDPDGPMLAVMRIRATSVSVADDPREAVTYTIRRRRRLTAS